MSSRSLNASNTLQSVTDDGNIIAQLLRQNAKLKSALKTKKKLNNPDGEMLREYIDPLQACLERIEQKLKKFQDNFQKKLDSAGKISLDKFTELERKISSVEDKCK